MTTPTPTVQAGRQFGRPDLFRQIAVTASAVLGVLGTLVGIGVLGSRVEQSSGGALSATATLLAPATPAFSIWSVIYLGLGAYTVWQWSPRAAISTRNRWVGWLVALSMLLNAGWLLVTQAGWLWASVVVIVALVVVLGVVLVRLSATAAATRVEAVVLDGTLGLYLGWVSVATCANITATLVAQGVRPSATLAQALAVVVLVCAGAIGVALARVLRGQLAVGAALAWGLVWTGFGRLATEPQSVPTAITAFSCAGVVVAATLAARFAQSTREQRRA